MKVLLAALLLVASQTMAVDFDLEGYQDPDGAVRLKRGGDFMDPYFALKALLLAERYGLEAKPALTALIGWLLPRQKADGSFDRYCRRADGLWAACQRADADDSMLALWLEALDVATPPQGAPPGWVVSAGWAEAALERHRDGSGVYRIFSEQPVALFMDNVEILAAQRHLAASAEKRGDRTAAAHWKARSAAQEEGIRRVFGDGFVKPLRISTQDRSDWEFYPDAVAQPFGWLHGYPRAALAIPMRRWLRRHGQAWRRFADGNAPWGIIALVALDAGETNVARDWHRRQQQARAGEHWNVLEEAAYQAIGADPRIAGRGRGILKPCTEYRPGRRIVYQEIMGCAGARPKVIRMAPVYRALGEEGETPLHPTTGQHDPDRFRRRPGARRDAAQAGTGDARAPGAPAIDRSGGRAPGHRPGTDRTGPNPALRRREHRTSKADGARSLRGWQGRTDPGHPERRRRRVRRLILAVALLAARAAQAETPVPDNSPDPLARTHTLPAVAPEATGSFSMGASHSALSSGFGTWNAVEARLVVQHADNTWYADVARRREFEDQGTAYGVGLSRVLNPDWYASGFISGSSGGFFLPRRRIDLFLHRKLLDDRSLVATLGVGRVDAKDGHRDTSIFLSATLYTRSRLVMEGGVRVNRSDPGEVDSTRRFLALTWGEAKQQYLSARVEWGREAYQLISPGAVISDFSSTLATVGWRRWITRNTGIQLTGEYYENPNYRRRGIGLAIFRDF